MDIEEKREDNLKRNKQILDGFEKWLKNSVLTDKTINKHISNVAFFINEYLNYYDITPAEKGWREIESFLGDWLIRKAPCSKSAIKSNIASLKKFYKYLVEEKMVSNYDYQKLLYIINENKEVWIESLEMKEIEDFLRTHNKEEGEKFLELFQVSDEELKSMEEKYSLEDYKKELLNDLFTNIKKFSKIKPWTYLFDTDIFGIELENLNETLYCCVLGSAGDTYGIMFYMGAEGLHSYFRTLDKDYDLPEEQVHINNSIGFYLENREDITKEDYDLIKKSDVKFSGKKQWPMLRSFKPGYLPDSWEDEEVEYINLIMEFLNGYLLDLKKDPSKAAMMEEGKCYIREYYPDDSYEEKVEEYDDIFTSEDGFLPVVISYDELEIKRLNKSSQKVDSVWELEYFYGPMPVEEDEEVYFPAMMLMVDSKTEAIIGYDITHPRMVNVDLQQLILKFIKESGVIPKKVAISREETLVYVIDLFENLGVEVELVDKLNLIPVIKEEMFFRIKDS